MYDHGELTTISRNISSITAVIPSASYTGTALPVGKRQTSSSALDPEDVIRQREDGKGDPHVMNIVIIVTSYIGYIHIF